MSSSENENGFESVKGEGSGRNGMNDNEQNEEDHNNANGSNNEKPKRPLSAYNFFLKEERKNILKAMVVNKGSNIDTTASSTPSLSDSDNAKDQKNMAQEQKRSVNRRPMKKRRLVDAAPEDGTDASTASSDVIDQMNNEMSFERIGKLIGERWQEVKAKPELFVKYEKLAANDHKRYTKDMKSYNDRKKTMLLSAVNSSENLTETKIDNIITTDATQLLRSNVMDGQRSFYGRSDAPIAQISNSTQMDRIDQKDVISNNEFSSSAANSVLSAQDFYYNRALQEQFEQLQATGAVSSAQGLPFVNLQSLLASQLQQQLPATAVPLDFFAASNQHPANTSAAVLAQLSAAQLPILCPSTGAAQNAATSAPDNHAINFALLRQQEELAMLRQETLYRELVQMEQAKAYLASAQGSQGAYNQQPAFAAAPYAATTLEALLAAQQQQQSTAAGLQLAAFQQQPQKAQILSLLSNLQNPAAAFHRYVFLHCVLL